MTETEADSEPVVFLEEPSVPYGQLEDCEKDLPEPRTTVMVGDAGAINLPDATVDLIVTSPPYWQKRDYGVKGQIGLEPTPEGYVDSLMRCMREWARLLTPYGSVFLNVGDTYQDRSLVGVPALIEVAARNEGWIIRNRIIWAKTGGMPDPVTNRLANRYEYVIHLTRRPSGYYYDLNGYSEEYGNGANPGDVWDVALRRNVGSHLAPFPKELVDRAIDLACPRQVCTVCGKPRTRVLARTNRLNPARPQARRAMELAKQAGLTPEHIRAIQAFGVSDVGKATQFQTGTGHSARRVVELAMEAKKALGGYFREFTFAKKATIGWTDCGHHSYRRGRVLDPFVGTGTTLRAALDAGLDSIGVDLKPVLDRDIEELTQ